MATTSLTDTDTGRASDAQRAALGLTLEHEVYIDRDKALATINRWIRDGSNLIEWGSYMKYDMVTLLATDGCHERFFLLN